MSQCNSRSWPNAWAGKRYVKPIEASEVALPCLILSYSASLNFVSMGWTWLAIDLTFLSPSLWEMSWLSIGPVGGFYLSLKDFPTYQLSQLVRIHFLLDITFSKTAKVWMPREILGALLSRKNILNFSFIFRNRRAIILVISSCNIRYLQSRFSRNSALRALKLMVRVQAAFKGDTIGANGWICRSKYGPADF